MDMNMSSWVGTDDNIRPLWHDDGWVDKAMTVQLWNSPFLSASINNGVYCVKQN